MLLTCFNSFKLTHQIKCEILLITITHLLFIIVFITIGIFLISLGGFKDMLNHLDTHEYAEMSYIENLLENSQILLEESFQDYASLIAKMYFTFSKTPIILPLNPDMQIIETLTNPSTVDPSKIIAKWCKASPCATSSAGSDAIINDMSLYLSQISSQKIFGTKDNGQVYFAQVFIVDTIDEYVYAYPGDLTEFNTAVDFKELRFRGNEAFVKHAKDIILFSGVFPNNLQHKEKYELPFYDETPPFAALYNKKAMNDVQMTCLCAVKKDYEPMKDSYDFTKLVYVIGKTSSVKLIFDPLMKRINNIWLLKAKVYFPYQLMHKNLCLLIKTLGMIDSKELDALLTDEIMTSFKNIEDCFDNTTKLPSLSKHKKYKDWTNVEMFHSLTNLHSKSNLTDTLTAAQMKEMDENLFSKNITAFNQTVNKRLEINGQKYKVRKGYSPLSQAILVDYYYPINNLYMNIMFKDEGLMTNISSAYQIRFLACLINCVIFTFILSLIILTFIIVMVNRVTEKIQQPLDQLNAMVSGEFDKEHTMEIDDFASLITKLDQIIKGDLAMKQAQNQTEEIRYKFDIERFDKEFEFVENAIVVKEEMIMEMIERDNDTSKILKEDIEKMKSDPYVNQSKIYMEVIRRICEVKEKEREKMKEREGMEIMMKGAEKGTVGRRKGMLKGNCKIIENAYGIDIATEDGDIEEEDLREFFKADTSLQNKNSLYEEGQALIKMIEKDCLFYDLK